MNGHLSSNFQSQCKLARSSYRIRRVPVQSMLQWLDFWKRSYRESLGEETYVRFGNFNVFSLFVKQLLDSFSVISMSVISINKLSSRYSSKPSSKPSSKLSSKPSSKFSGTNTLRSENCIAFAMIKMSASDTKCPIVSNCR